MRSEDKYRLVVDDDDVVIVQSSSQSTSSEGAGASQLVQGTPMFAIRGLEVSLDTSKGPVNFVPLFFSKTELQEASVFTVYLQELHTHYLISFIRTVCSSCYQGTWLRVNTCTALFSGHI